MILFYLLGYLKNKPGHNLALAKRHYFIWHSVGYFVWYLYCTWICEWSVLYTYNDFCLYIWIVYLSVHIPHTAYAAMHVSYIIVINVRDLLSRWPFYTIILMIVLPSDSTLFTHWHQMINCLLMTCANLFLVSKVSLLGSLPADLDCVVINPALLSVDFLKLYQDFDVQPNWFLNTVSADVEVMIQWPGNVNALRALQNVILDQPSIISLL